MEIIAGILIAGLAIFGIVGFIGDAKKYGIGTMLVIAVLLILALLFL